MNEIKQRPILFSTPMVQAILEGRKTQTRRTIKPQPDSKATLFSYQPDQWPKKPWIAKFKFKEIEGAPYYEVTNDYKCPYGKTGDILWVRETWAVTCGGKYEYKADGGFPPRIIHESANESGGEDVVTERWFPSIHMPKEACRLFLRITDIRVERLQDITEEDAKAEGVLQFKDGSYKFYVEPMPANINPGCSSAKDSFFSLWRTINGAESLKANQWVWVISFERTEKPGKSPS